MRMRSERGSTLIEFALGSGLVFLTLFGILEFGWAIWQYNMVANLAQEGARYAAVHGQNSGSAKTAAQVQTYVQGRAAGMSTVTVTTVPVAGPSVVAAGNTIQVQVTVPHTRFTSLVTSGAISLSSTATMTVAR